MASEPNRLNDHVIDMDSILRVETSTPPPHIRSFSPLPVRRHHPLTIRVVSSHDDDIHDTSDSDMSDDDVTDFSMHPSGHGPQLRRTRNILFPAIPEETNV